MLYGLFSKMDNLVPTNMEKIQKVFKQLADKLSKAVKTQGHLEGYQGGYSGGHNSPNTNYSSTENPSNSGGYKDGDLYK
jgi:hypothetical protein